MVGQTLGHYRVLEQIGAGGMGLVFRAHDERLDRDVAIKVLPPGTLTDEKARKRFRKEALALSKLNHPNIGTVHDFDTQDGVDFLVMELIPGITLDEKLTAGALPEKEITRLGTQLAEGLAAAHKEGVIHRDLKPSNLRVTSDGRLKILDFGLAKLYQPASPTATTESLSQSHGPVGTPPYMAPEQLRGHPADPRSDIWAAGAVLYEVASGQPPFPQKSSTLLIDAILNRPPQAPSELNSQLSLGLENIILKSLDKDPGRRYQSAKELLVALERLSIPGAQITGRAALAARPMPRGAWAAAGAVVVALAVVAGLWLERGRKAPESAQVTPSIAVLPFVDMSPEKNQEYFADGLAEDLLNNLAKVPGLKVVGRTSSFQFKGKNEDLRVIGEKLNVVTVLEGSVRREGKRVRITAQLVNAGDGFDVWSESYDRDLHDIFAVQDEIARAVAGSLKVKLLGERTTAPSGRSKNVEAYNAYLQGRYFYERRSKEDLEKAVANYEQAIRLDPDYAAAWAGLGAARTWQAASGYVPVDEGYRKAQGAVEKALALDANLAEAHTALGAIGMFYTWDWGGADASYQRALALEPGNATVVTNSAQMAATLGRFEQAMTLDRRAIELDPLSAPGYSFLGLNALYAGRLEEAAAAYKKALELNPEFPGAHNPLGRIYLAQSHPQAALDEMERETEPAFRLQGLALAYHALGRKQESDAALAELTAKHQVTWAYQIAQVYAFRGEVDQAFAWLERCYAQHDGGLAQIKGDPLLKNIERDPRYAAFLKKMRLPV